MDKRTVVVLGASPNPERYSNRAVKRLLAKGCCVIPVARGGGVIEGLATRERLCDIEEEVDVLTVYVGPKTVKELISEIVALRPKKVIMNPGAESWELKKALDEAGIPHEEACTLVLLSTGAF